MAPSRGLESAHQTGLAQTSSVALRPARPREPPTPTTRMAWGAAWRKGGSDARRGKGWAAEPWSWRCSSCGCGKNKWAQQCCGNCGQHWKDGWGGRRTQTRGGSAWDAGPPTNLRPQKQEAAQPKAPCHGPADQQAKGAEATAFAACLEVLRTMDTPAASAARKMLEEAIGAPLAPTKDPEKAIGPLLRKRDKKQAQLDKQQAWVAQCEQRLAEAKAREAEISEKLQALQEELSEVRRLLADEPEAGGPAPPTQRRTPSLDKGNRADPGVWPTLQQQRENWKQQGRRKRRQTGPAEGEAGDDEGRDMEEDTSEGDFGQEL